MRLHFNQSSVVDIDAMIKAYGASEFESPYRSTLPLLSLVKHGGDMWLEILRELGMSADAALYAEYTVAPQGGRGKASHTDLMVCEDDSARAIEAKWGEPQYQTVAKWLEEGGNSENRQAVLSGWLGMLGGHTDPAPKLEDVRDVVYQLVHRAASACSAGGSPGLAYLSFSPPPPGCAPGVHLKADLEMLLKSIHGKPSLSACLVQVQLEPTAVFNRLKDLPKSSPDTAKEVRAALLDGPLFLFKSYTVERVRPSAA